MSAQLLNWETVEAILAGSRLALLYGPPGTGKTTAAVNCGRNSGKSVYNVTLTDETPAAELRGHWIPSGSEWKWMHGPAMLAFLNGGVLVLNEIDKASSDCLDFCHGLLDDPGVAAITLPTGETVFPSPDFQVIATMNGDLHDLPDAIADRFAIAVEITLPHPDALNALPEDLRSVAGNIVGRDVDEDRPATLRRVRAYAQAREIAGVGPESAAIAVFAHRARELSDAFTLAESR